MNIIFNISNNQMKPLLDNKKLLFFANNFSENTKKANKVYFCNKGQIIGEAKIKCIEIIPRSKVGTTNFILFWAQKIKKDKFLYDRIKQVFSYKIEGYDNYIKISHLYNEWALEYFDKNGEFPDIISLGLTKMSEYYKKKEKADEIISECDEWLTDIGYYNGGDESFFRKYMEISNIILYNTSKELNSFKNKNNKSIIKPPKTWCYTLN